MLPFPAGARPPAEVKEEPQSPPEESSSSPVSDNSPWESCSGGSGQVNGWLEKDNTGCFNPDDGFYAKASKNDVVGGFKYTGSWESCKGLCAAAAQGDVPQRDLECGKGHYVTYNKDTGSCYFYRPPSASANGCEEWRAKDSDRLGMYCGPEGGSDSSGSSQDNPPPSPSPPPSDDSSDSSQDNPPPSPSPGNDSPWESCSGGSEQVNGWLEKDNTGCFNPDDGFYAKASKNDVVGGFKYTGWWESCKGLCAAAAQGDVPQRDFECGKGHYVTYNKDTGSCYFYRPPSASANGCEEWRAKDSDRLGMYCGPEGGSDSSGSSQDNPPPSPSPPPSDDSSDSSQDNPPPSPSPGNDSPWESCSGGSEQVNGWLEKDNTGCFNPDDGFYAKASKNDVVGGFKYTGWWESCKGLCAAAAQGDVPQRDFECGKGHYVTYNKDTGSCYFYRPPSASANGCEEWRAKDSDRLGMYCGPEGGSDSSDSSQDNPPPSPSPPPSDDSSDSPDVDYGALSFLAAVPFFFVPGPRGSRASPSESFFFSQVMLYPPAFLLIYPSACLAMAPITCLGTHDYIQ